MQYKLTIDKTRNTPAYRQLVEGLTVLIQSGQLKPGDKIPSERELQDQLGISRGTIKKAIEKLSNNNIIEIIPNSGSFVSYKQDTITTSRKEQAVSQIRGMISQLSELNFSCREISNLVELSLMEHQEQIENFHVAVIDCNPEALAIFHKQMNHISHLRLSPFLLDELRKSPTPEHKLESFRLIITTSTHFTEVIGMLPKLKDRVMQAVVSPSQESVIALAKIGLNQDIGIIAQSKRFNKMIASKLQDFNIPLANIDSLFLDQITSSSLNKFLSEKKVVVIPPDRSITPDRQSSAVIQQFKQNHGTIISYTFQIERGSLLHIEERIKSLFAG